MKVGVITIGDEILIGQIIDTNTAWISQKMTDAGFEVVEKVSIGDNANQIKDTIISMFTRVDIILTTGGLGPTKDDITKKTLCELFDTELIFDYEVLDNIKKVLATPDMLNPLTRDQAYVPKDCTVIQNRVGTAPITWFDREDGKILISMPGVPYEMRYVMENEILPRFQKSENIETYLKKIFIVGGYTESALAMKLADFENNLPEGFGLAYLPSLSLMKLRLFVRGDQYQREFDSQVRLLEEILGSAIIADRDIPLEQILGEHLKANNLTIGTAESCTGGNIAHMITSIAGSSTYFIGSVVSYASEVKVHSLGVLPETIDQFGVVSKETAEEMALGLQKKMNVDCVIAITGIAGPDGGSEELPVGTVWISTYCKGQILTRRYQVGFYRESNIVRASNRAMLQMLDMINLI